MKTFTICVLLIISFSSCIVEIELDPSYINVGPIDEYETKEVIHEVWSDEVLIYEEAIYRAWLEIEFQNLGGIRANNVWAEIIFYNGNREIQTTTIYLPDIRPGNAYVYVLDTGFESINDYADFEISVYWD